MKKNGNLMNFLKRLFVFEIMNAIKLSLRNLQILLLVISQQGRCILCSSFLRIIWRFLKMHVIFGSRGWKTSIVYGAYAYLHSLPNDNAKHIDKLLVVGPLSSFGPWELEYEECFGHKPSVKRLISGISKTDKQDYLISSRTSELTLISYASLISLQKELGFSSAIIK